MVTGTAADPAYNFTALDVLYDGIIAAGVTPIIELSFMPRAIANCSRNGYVLQRPIAQPT